MGLKRRRIKGAILDLLADGESRTSQDISIALPHLTEREIARCCERMADDGRVKGSGNWGWYRPRAALEAEGGRDTGRE